MIFNLYKQAKRSAAQWMALHPTNVVNKVQFIVEHFTNNLAHQLNGKAKATVVTSSRAPTICYKTALDRYIGHHSKYGFIHLLVSFSGKITGNQVMHQDDEAFKDDVLIVDENAEFTEQHMNPEVGSQDLRFAFKRPEYRMMLVADKFQTGFDQPKLAAMYVDKKIANHVEIVQTFAQLNRMASGKDEVFIIISCSAMATSEAAFEKAYAKGDEEGIESANYHQDEYAEQIKTLMGFKSDLGRFYRIYSYIAQLIDFGNPELENFAAFSKLLQKTPAARSARNPGSDGCGA